METEATQICLNNLPEWAAVVGTTLVTIAAGLANFIGKDNVLGKVVNWLGLNFTVEKVKK